MTSDNHNGLTAYQKAILTHLGIVPWQLKSSSSDIPDVQSVQTSNGPVQTTNSLEHIKPTQEQRQAGLEKLKATVPTARKTVPTARKTVPTARKTVPTAKKVEKQKTRIPDQVLILVEDNKEYANFINDVMLSAGIGTEHYRFALPSEQDDFQDFKFLWSISTIPIDQKKDILAKLAGQHLTTMKINSNNVVALKKQIWQILQNHPIQT